MRRKVWTQKMDKLLKLGIAAGRSRADIGEELGVSKNSVIARYHRLMGTDFQSDAKYKRLTEERRRERLEKKRQIEDHALEKMARLIHAGCPRRLAMKAARQSGATYASIASHFGITRQAVQQSLAR